MPPTVPEGLSFTPPPMMDPRPPERVSSIGSSSFMMSISIILGIILGVGGALKVVGKAFYVEREEYNVAAVRIIEDKITVSENLKQMKETLGRQEQSLKKLSEDVDSIKQSLASMRGRRY